MQVTPESRPWISKTDSIEFSAYIETFAPYDPAENTPEWSGLKDIDDIIPLWPIQNILISLIRRCNAF